MQRSARVAAEIKKEISLLLRELKDPRISGLISVVDVNLTKDLSSAKIRISVFGSEIDQQQETLEALQGASGLLRGEIARRLRLRIAPEIKFILDHSIEYGQKINRVLREIENDEG